MIAIWENDGNTYICASSNLQGEFGKTWDTYREDRNKIGGVG